MKYLHYMYMSYVSLNKPINSVCNKTIFFRECPLSLEAAHGLLSLGVKGAEVASFMMSASANLASLEWYVLLYIHVLTIQPFNFTVQNLTHLTYTNSLCNI